MNLSVHTLKSISPEKVILPDDKIFDLPEKVLQFGTGVLLRGLPDYFIDKANRNGIFNGRIVMIKSTAKGDASSFEKQDGLYTLCERGIVDGKKISVNIINSSVSRVLIAQTDWGEILACAHNPDLKIIISNTTEVGIQLVKEDIRDQAPVSYPGKLLAFLYERFKAFSGSEDSGFVIVPTELITDNAGKLESIVLELAHLNSLESDFIEWLGRYNFFCNSLVDRIVTGMPNDEVRSQLENELGYTDDLLTVSEIYSLWAIEGNEKIRSILSFAEADDSVVIGPDIDLHRELKLRLLNGTHTLTSGLAFLANYETVLSTMEDVLTESFITDLMRNELAPSIPYEINDVTKQAFIAKVLDRFRNPHINHPWKNITLNYTSKIRMRCIPLLLNFYKNNGKPPVLFSLGFAAYLYFMKGVKQNDKDVYGEKNGQAYLIEDPMAKKFYDFWQNDSVDALVSKVLKDESLWGADLSILPGFETTVTNDLKNIMNNGMKVTLEKAYSKKSV